MYEYVPFSFFDTVDSVPFVPLFIFMLLSSNLLPSSLDNSSLHVNVYLIFSAFVTLFDIFSILSSFIFSAVISTVGNVVSAYILSIVNVSAIPTGSTYMFNPVISFSIVVLVNISVTTLLNIPTSYNASVPAPCEANSFTYLSDTYITCFGFIKALLNLVISALLKSLPSIVYVIVVFGFVYNCCFTFVAGVSDIVTDCAFALTPSIFKSGAVSFVNNVALFSLVPFS